MNHYPVETFWDEDDQSVIAVAPDLPGCSAGGNTEEEALRELKTAMQLWLGAARNMGRYLPNPNPNDRHPPLEVAAGSFKALG